MMDLDDHGGKGGRGSGARVVRWRVVAAAAATTAVKIADTERESGGDRQMCGGTRWITWSGKRWMVRTMGGERTSG
jgi:hypothetical protein